MVGWWKKKEEVDNKDSSEQNYVVKLSQPAEGALAGGGTAVSSGQDLLEAIRSRFGSLRRAVGRGCSIEGKLSFESPVLLEGEVKGEVFSKSAVVFGVDAVARVGLDAPVVIILGDFSGNISAGRLEIFAGAKFEGQAKIKDLVLKEGALFNGSCEMDPC